MNELLKIFLSMALTSVILIPLVWILQRIFNRYLSKGKIYYSWMIVFFFLTIPFAYFFFRFAKDSVFMWRNKTEFDGVTSIVVDQSGVVLQH
ncbi:peptidase M56, partial [Listeria monocytogenes]|nr:peptidase M56 [Listeria monocytogenes]